MEIHGGKRTACKRTSGEEEVLRREQEEHQYQKGNPRKKQAGKKLHHEFIAKKTRERGVTAGS